MKTAISLPDDVFLAADKLARRLGKSRSQLYADAVSEHIARYDPEDLTEAWSRVADAVHVHAAVKDDEFVDAAGRRLLTEVEW